MIKGQKISWKYNPEKEATLALRNVSFEIKKGGTTIFMGPSGAGKTTLLKCLANIYSNYEGKIVYQDKDLKQLEPVERASTIGFVLQQFHLFPHMTVMQNCVYPLTTVLKLSEAEGKERMLEILQSLGMESFIHAYPNQLSGGQQQRIAIARALGLRPKILAFDEPTSALDPESKRSFESLLFKLNEQGITVAISSHDMPFIGRVLDRVYFMEAGTIIETFDRDADTLHSTVKIKNYLNHL